MDTTTLGIEYPEGTDAITDYPAVAEAAAETIDGLITADRQRIGIASGKRTSTVSTSATSFASGADLLASDLAFTADGVSDYVLEVSAAGYMLNSTSPDCRIAAKLDGAEYGSARTADPASSYLLPFNFRIPIPAPAAGAHTINARVYLTGAATVNVYGGAGGAPATDCPILVSIRKL